MNLDIRKNIDFFYRFQCPCFTRDWIEYKDKLVHGLQHFLNSTTNNEDIKNYVQGEKSMLTLQTRRNILCFMYDVQTSEITPKMIKHLYNKL